MVVINTDESIYPNEKDKLLVTSTEKRRCFLNYYLF